MGLSRKKKTVFRLTLVAGSLLLVFLAGEATVRILEARRRQDGAALSLKDRLARSARTDLEEIRGQFNLSGLVRASANPDVVYELKPNLTGTFLGKPVRINRAGFRGPEVTKEKPSGIYRIAGLGDSVIFGWGVGQTNTYLHILEQRLNALDDPRRFETLNFGVPGYNTCMEVEVFASKVLSYRPDLVILQFINNDWDLPLFMKPVPDPYALDRSFLLDLVATRLDRVLADRNINERVDGLLGLRHMGAWAGEKHNDVIGQYRHLTGSHNFRDAMRRLGGMLKEHGIDILVMRGSIEPHKKKVLESICGDQGFTLFTSGPYSTAAMKSRGLPLDKQTEHEVLWVSETDHHPYEFGHRIYADALMDQMARKGLIDYTLPYNDILDLTKE